MDMEIAAEFQSQRLQSGQVDASGTGVVRGRQQQQQLLEQKEAVANSGSKESSRAANFLGGEANIGPSHVLHHESQQAARLSQPDQGRNNLSYAAKAATVQSYNHANKGGAYTAPRSTTEKASANPCVDDNFDPNVGVLISDGELLTALSHLPAPPHQPSAGMRVVRFEGNTTTAKSRVLPLSIIYRVDFNPSRDHIEAWVDDVLVQNMNMTSLWSR